MPRPSKHRAAWKARSPSSAKPVPGRITWFLGTLLVVLSSVAWLAAVAGWFRGARRVPVLREAAEAEKPIDRYPSVSVVVAARDEEAGVEEALGSVLDQDYPGSLEVVAVNDRSTDHTGGIIADLAARKPDRLKPLEVEELPEGWLGKNHALYCGAAGAGASGCSSPTRTSVSRPIASSSRCGTQKSNASTTSRSRPNFSRAGWP